MAWQRAKAKAKGRALGPSQPEAVEGLAGVGVAVPPDLPELPPNADIEGLAGVSVAAAPDLPELPPIADIEGPVGLSAAAAPHPRARPNSQRGPRSGVAAQIAHIQTTTQLCSPRPRFTRLCREIMQQIAPDVEFRFEFQALNAHQHGTEDYCAHMFVNGSIAAAHRNVPTLGVQTPMAGLWSEEVHHHLGVEAEALPKSENSNRKTRSRSLS